MTLALAGAASALAAAGVLVLVVPFALLLLLIVDHWGPLQRLDLDLDLAARLNSFAFSHPNYVALLKVITTVGHPAVFEAVAVIVAAWLLKRRRPRLAVWLAVTVFGGGLLSTIVKNAVGRSCRTRSRTRPMRASRPATPSGASSASGRLPLVFLPYARRSTRPATAFGVLVVLAIGFLRLGLGLHYLSDVLGGYVLGAGWLAVSTASLHRVATRPR